MATFMLFEDSIILPRALGCFAAEDEKDGDKGDSPAVIHHRACCRLPTGLSLQVLLREWGSPFSPIGPHDYDTMLVSALRIGCYVQLSQT